MNRRKSGKIAAVIDISSNLLKMKICQLKKGEIEMVDRLEYPIRLGNEVFHGGKISFECLWEMSSILHGYAEAMQQYGVTQYKMVATTALREAKNRDYITDQLKIQNNAAVQILEDDQEKTLIYSEILNSIQAMDDLPPGSTLISFIGTGSIGISIFNGTDMVFSQNIAIGPLKLYNMLSGIQESTGDFGTVAEEYLDLVIGHIPLPDTEKKIPNLVLTGNEIEMIARICGIAPAQNRYLIPSELIERLFQEVRTMPPAAIGPKYGLAESSAEILYPALVIYVRLIRLTHAPRVVSPKVELWDALMRQLLIPKSKSDYEKHVVTNAVSCAQRIADQYRCPKAHSDTVRRFSCRIFDKTKSLHGLDFKKRLILELAAILHDCGHYINSKDYLRSTFDLVKNIDIYGLTDEDMLMVAYLCRYDENLVPRENDADFSALDRTNRLTISKLVAIFRLANSLDKSQMQKLGDIRVKLEKDRLVISGRSDDNLYLEKWAFGLCSPFFQEVFGIHPVFAVKSEMLHQP